MKRKILNSIVIIFIILGISGCVGTNDFVSIPIKENNSLTSEEKSKIFSYMISTYGADNYYYSFGKDNVSMKLDSYDKNGRILPSYKGKNTFSEEKIKYLEENMNSYFKEYALHKNDILNAINFLNKIQPTFEFENKLNLEEKLLNSLYPQIKYKRFDLIPEKIFVDFKKSGKTSLEEFLDGYSIIQLEFQQTFYYNNFKIYSQVKLEHPNINKVICKDKIIISLYEIAWTILPDSFEISDENISMKFTNYQTVKYSVELINLTNDFIDLNSLSLYLENKINSINLNQKMPPNSKNSNNQIVISIPSGVNGYQKLKTLNEIFSIGGALEYSIRNKNKTIYKSIDLKVKDALKYK